MPSSSDRGRSSRGGARGRPGPRLRPGSRLRRGELIYLVAAVALFVLMFVDWFGVKGDSGNLLVAVVPIGGGNAWQTLEVTPVFLMLAIAVAIGAALMRLGGSDWKPAVPANGAVTVLGALAAILILIKILSPPGPDESAESITVEPTLKVGVFLALAAAIGIAYGGYRAMREEGDSFGGIAKRLESDRPRPKAVPKREKTPRADPPAKPAAKPKRPRPAAKSASKRRSPSSSD